MSKNNKKKIDFVLIVPYQEISAFGVRIIESYLQHKGHEVATLYFKKRDQLNSYPTVKEISLLVDFVTHVNPLLIGFSVMSPFNSIARTLTKRVRDITNAPVIWGGIHPTICPEDCIDIVDICCIGEGEEPVHQILSCLKEDGRIDKNTPNCWVNDNGKVIKNQIRYMCNDLDNLPIPTLTNEGKYFIENDNLKNEDPYITYILNRNKYDFKAFRGCPFVCAYCGNKSIKDLYKPMGYYSRKRSVDSVIMELKEAIMKFPNIKTIHSYDESFISDIEYVKEFNKKYKNEINLPFTCDAILTLLSDEKVSIMADAGLKRVNVGIEAFSEDVRSNVYRRKMPDLEIIEKAKILHKHNVFIMYDFIYDNPLETTKDLEVCFWNLIAHLPRPCSFNNYSLSHLPKTELTQRFLKEGIIAKSDIVGTSDKGLVQWKVTSNYARDKGVLFWIVVYNLYGTEIKLKGLSFLIPVCIIKAIAHTKNYFLAILFQKAVTTVSTLLETTYLALHK